MQSASWTLKEEVRFTSKRITSRDWGGYPIITFPEVPEMKVVMLDRPAERSLGVGKAAQGQIAAAIGNAIAHATGAGYATCRSRRIESNAPSAEEMSMRGAVEMAGERLLGNVSMSEHERKIRIELAACYRLAQQNGRDELIYNHISARVPGREHHFLMNRFGLAFEEVTASNLVRVNIEGRFIGDSKYRVNAARFTVDSAIHDARPEVRCVIHLENRGGSGAFHARRWAVAADSDGDALPKSASISQLRGYRAQSRRASAPCSRPWRQIRHDPAQSPHAGGLSHRRPGFRDDVPAGKSGAGTAAGDGLQQQTDSGIAPRASTSPLNSAQAAPAGAEQAWQAMVRRPEREDISYQSGSGSL